MVVVVDEVGHYLGVRLGLEGVALGEQKLLQGDIVFDDAVVYHDHL